MGLCVLCLFECFFFKKGFLYLRLPASNVAEMLQKCNSLVAFENMKNKIGRYPFIFEKNNPVLAREMEWMI